MKLTTHILYFLKNVKKALLLENPRETPFII